MLSEKYVLHIPLHKFENGKISSLDIDGPLNSLVERLNEEGFDGFYTQNVKSHYKSRVFDELLITVYTSGDRKDLLEDIFCDWFETSNEILAQEAYAFERNDQLIIRKIQ